MHSLVAKDPSFLHADSEDRCEPSLGARHFVGLVMRQLIYEGRAKSSVINRLPWFYPRDILKCFTALEWCVE